MRLVASTVISYFGFEFSLPYAIEFDQLVRFYNAVHHTYSLISDISGSSSQCNNYVSKYIVHCILIIKCVV